jgi:uncharacterized short protein YbdD (DUF466 family)
MSMDGGALPQSGLARLRTGWACGRAAWARARQALRLMVGLPDYDAYLQHRRAEHPHEPALSYREFFRETQRRRYEGARGGRCC